MRKTSLIFAIVCFAIAALSIVGVVNAAEKLVTAPVKSVTIANDVNGHEYVRLIVEESRTLNGVSYSVGIPVMGFGDQAAALKSMKEGDVFKGICQERSFQGRDSYTLIKTVP